MSFRVADNDIGKVKVPCILLIKFCQIRTDQDLLLYMSAINVSTVYHVIKASMIERDLLDRQKLFCKYTFIKLSFQNCVTWQFLHVSQKYANEIRKQQ